MKEEFERSEIDRTQFTVVFEGDISKLPFNPMTAQTVFGKVIASGYGNAFEQVEELIEIIDGRA